VPGPSYPAGGNHGSASGFDGIAVTFPFSAVSVYNPQTGAGYLGDAPFINNLLLPEEFTVTIVNLNAAGEQDGNNPNGNQWGPYLSGGSTSNVDPDGNPLTENENTTFNTNTAGTSRTGAPPHTFINSGHWLWNQSNGSAPGTGWADSRSSNLVMSMTVNAVPEPTTLAMAGAGLLGLVVLGMRRRATSA